jgi:hypothetical protein
MLAGLELALFLWAPLIQDHASLLSTTPAVEGTLVLRAYHMLFTDMSAKCLCTSYDCFRDVPYL